MKTKNILFLTAITLLPIGGMAQHLEKNQSALIYFMPKTEVILDVEYERMDAKAGMFYQYSKRYLGTEDVVKENKISYRIKSASFQTRTIADKKRNYSLVSGKNNVGISLTDDGILCGINSACIAQVNNTFNYQLTPQEENVHHIVPLGEDQMMSGSVAKMAENTAKQIYRIRENRFNLLSGDVDKMPTEGEAIQLILNELREQEDALCEMFIGSTTTTVHHAYYNINLSDDQNDIVLFRFSALAGPVDSEDLSGTPITITVDVNKMKYTKAAKERKEIENAIYYNIPGNASIIVKQGIQLLAQTSVKVAQLGIAVPLEPAWLNKKICINPQTGLISQVE